MRPETANGTYRTVLAQYARHTATGELNYLFSPETQLRVSYTFDRMNRDFREIAWSSDNKYKVLFDSRALGWVDLKAWYERTQRTTSVYEFDQYNIVQGNPAAHPMLPFLEKFDEAPLHKNEAQVWRPSC